MPFRMGVCVCGRDCVILAAQPSQAVVGALLASGVFVHILATECIPKIRPQLHENVRHTLLFLFCFALGAVPIGLVLINHGHCKAEE